MVVTAAKWKEIKEDAAVAVAAGASLEAVAAVKRKVFVKSTGSQPFCIRLCRHVGCGRSVFARGVCRGHGPRCKHVGCTKSVHVGGVCREHGPSCSHVGCGKDVHTRNVCKGHDETK